MARSSRQAGEACEALSKRARPGGERSRWRARALTWLGKSLELYAGLGKTGALTGEEAAAPREVGQLVTKLKSG
jgi:hypothetical protein